MTLDVVAGICRRCPPRYSDHGTGWSVKTWREVNAALTAAITKAAADSAPVAQLRDRLGDAGVDGKPAAAVVAAAAPRFADIRRALADAAVGTGASRLVAFDWNVRVALSSSKLGAFRTPLAHVILTYEHGDGSREDVAMELTQPELDELISSLTRAQSDILALNA